MIGKCPKLRVVQVTYEGGDIITTSMTATLTNKEIEEYFKIGKKFNIGSGVAILCYVVALLINVFGNNTILVTKD